MSVIFGIHEADRITIVGDKREYNSKTNEYNDNSQKVFAIHDQLCIAIAGNNAISMAINLEISKHKVQIGRLLTTTDVTIVIKKFYERLIEKSPSLLSHPFCCIYGGIDENGKPSLICGTRCKEGYIHNRVSEFIFAPADADTKECNGILIKNYIVLRGDFPKNILREVSEKSKFVSSCGDKWVFNIQKKQGILTRI